MSRAILNGKTQSMVIDEPKEIKTLQGSGEFMNLMTVEKLYEYFGRKGYKTKKVSND